MSETKPTQDHNNDLHAAITEFQRVVSELIERRNGDIVHGALLPAGATHAELHHVPYVPEGSFVLDTEDIRALVRQTYRLNLSPESASGRRVIDLLSRLERHVGRDTYRQMVRGK